MAKPPSLFESAAALRDMMEFENKLRPLKMQLAALLQASADGPDKTVPTAELKAIFDEIQSHEPELERLTEKHRLALQYAAEGDG